MKIGGQQIGLEQLGFEADLGMTTAVSTTSTLLLYFEDKKGKLLLFF